jgi:hypothetical protein
VLLASHFKKSRFKFQKNAFKELIFILIYIILAMISFKGFTHFFTVQERKGEISTKIESDINSVKNMFTEYEKKVDTRMLGFSGFLDATIAGKNTNQPLYLSYFQIGGPDEMFQKNSKLNFFKDDIKPAEYDTMKLLALDWLNKSQQTILDIKPLGIFDVINNFEKNSNEWYQKIQQYDKTINTFKHEAQQEPFVYNLNFTSINEELTKQQAPNVISIIVLLIIHFLILVTYLLSMRDGKSPGFLKSLTLNEKESLGDL